MLLLAGLADAPATQMGSAPCLALAASAAFPALSGLLGQSFRAGQRSRIPAPLFLHERQSVSTGFLVFPEFV
jgi:hypothetical protein